MTDHEVPALSSDEERVGYRKPPRATRFKKGQSGNPLGRPKGVRNFASVIAATLSERITVTENGKRRRITKLQAGMKQLINRTATGDMKALALIMNLAQLVDNQTADAAPVEVTENDQQVISELMRRLGGPKP